VCLSELSLICDLSRYNLRHAGASGGTRRLTASASRPEPQPSPKRSSSRSASSQRCESVCPASRRLRRARRSTNCWTLISPTCVDRAGRARRASSRFCVERYREAKEDKVKLTTINRHLSHRRSGFVTGYKRVTPRLVDFIPAFRIVDESYNVRRGFSGQLGKGLPHCVPEPRGAALETARTQSLRVGVTRSSCITREGWG
jgi:hypothetical protein